MCGIAGLVDLEDRRPLPPGVLRAMADCLFHRGPDEDGYLELPGLGLASRRLSIVGLADGRQPIFNEDRSVAVVYNGELFDHLEQRAALEARGHRFVTHCDTEVIPHLWEDHGEGMFARLRGQFAVALWDGRQRQLALGRDRFGICPLYWARQGGWLLFASEIKALLASGMVEPRPDLQGINHLFTFFALPGPVTCFEGVRLLVAGRFLSIDLRGERARVSEHAYWNIDFPDRGDEDHRTGETALVDRFEELMLKSVERRLRADVPVVSYLSGGVDSGTVVALASRVRGQPIPTFTIRIDDPELDETDLAAVTARHVGTEPVVVRCGADDVLKHYPRLIEAAESPVIDTSCTALMMLAEEVHARGYKVALTGEGADEWLAGYPWYKVARLLGFLDVIPGLPLSGLVRRAYLWLTGQPRFARSYLRRVYGVVGGHNPWLDIYGLVSLNKLRFFSPWLRAELGERIAYADLDIPVERLQRWHPLNRALYFGIRIHLPGLLLNAKGDRVAMHSSVETRYPFLDEDVFDFLAGIGPRWKMRGFQEKYLLRRLAERWLPAEVAHRRKAMFRAPFDSFFQQGAAIPPFVNQLLSEESLSKTGYFDAQAVRHWRERLPGLKSGSNKRISVEMGLVGVLATQLWHQRFIDPSLADLPSSGIRGRRAAYAVPSTEYKVPSTRH
ncbi:MAG: asparagine synthase (glutamine-hydrolyzing) [Gemmataceae bacterium]|nr:asparagine synthase (glutamine-hydrolyzing) [Gemmataceae bacterium]